jgi:lysophospholipase L1-like esterase
MSGNNLTLTGAGFDTTGEKFGTAALSGGYGIATGSLVTGDPFTLEAWVKLASNPGAIEVAVGSNNAAWFGVDASGHATAIVGTSPGTITQNNSTKSIVDNVWHHMALVATSSATTLYVDGVNVSSVSPPQTLTFSTGMAVGCYGITYGNVWSGEIDEVAIWPSARYTANFTPPTAPYVGTEGMVALYHLDSNGTDSSAAAVTILPNNAAIVYSPYNWLVSSSGAQTINAGAYFSTIFASTSIILTFNVAADSSPVPELWYRIDGWAWTKVELAASLTLTMPADSAAWPQHLLEVVVKSTSEYVTRWSPQDAAVILTGMLLGTGATVTAPTPRQKHMLFLGDSITEGFHAVSNLGSGQNDPDGSDALNGWAYRQRELLGAEVGVAGFGGAGLTQGGTGGVPAIGSFWNMLWSGQARPFTPSPDLVVINIGTNDGANNASSASIQSAMASLLGAILSTLPNTRIAVLQPFEGAATYMSATQRATVTTGLQAAIAQVGGAVTWVPTTGIWTGTDSVDGIHPLGVINLGTIAPAVASLLAPVLFGLASSTPRALGVRGGLR